MTAKIRAAAVGALVTLSMTALQAHAIAPNTDPRPVTTVHKSWREVVITGTQVQRQAAERRRGEDVERPSGRRARPAVAKRPLTRQQVAFDLAVRRARCLAAKREVSQAYAAGRVLQMSADGCSVIRDRVNPPAVVITDNVVLTEVKRVGFPASVVHVQPGMTFVNLDTNVYADPKVFDRPVPILGQLVAIKATPSYTWHFGDGTSDTTPGPGAPYPDGDVTHHYLHRGKVVVSVTLDYDTWYRVSGEDWKQAGIVAIPGPGTAVQVCEARPVLTDPDDQEPDVPASGSCA
jgi:hypothetical protein